MICRNCNSQLQEGTVVCPYCGFNHSGQQNNVYGNIQQNNQGSIFDNQNYGQYNQQYNNYQNPVPRKKSKGCLIAVIIAVIVLVCFIGAVIVGGIALTNFIETAVNNIATEVETENGTVDTSGVMKDIDIIVDGFKEIGKTLETYEFPDLDGDGQPDVEFLDGDNLIVDLAYLGEFIADTFETASRVQVADGTHWQLLNNLNEIPSTENLNKILEEDAKSLENLNYLREEYGMYECYDSKHLETVKELLLKDISNEIMLLEEYLKVSEEIKNGDQSGVEDFYKVEELFKQKDLNLEAFYNILIDLGKSYGLDVEKISEYMMKNVGDIEMPTFE